MSLWNALILSLSVFGFLGFLILMSHWQEFKICLGIVRSWAWTLTETNMKAPRYCRRIKERMWCNFCPKHVVERSRSRIVSYCGIAFKSEEGILNE